MSSIKNRKVYFDKPSILKMKFSEFKKLYWDEPPYNKISPKERRDFLVEDYNKVTGRKVKK